MTNFNLPKFFFGKSFGQSQIALVRRSQNRQCCPDCRIGRDSTCIDQYKQKRNDPARHDFSALIDLDVSPIQDITARWISLFSALVIISTLLYKNYGMRDTAVMGLVVVLISAGLLAGRKGTFLSAQLF